MHETNGVGLTSQAYKCRVGRAVGSYPSQPATKLPGGREGVEGADKDTDGSVVLVMITGFLVFLMVLTMEQNHPCTQGWAALTTPSLAPPFPPRLWEGGGRPCRLPRAFCRQTAILHLMEGKGGPWLIAELRPPRRRSLPGFPPHLGCCARPRRAVA